jgi:hypothetical protein
MEVPAEQAARGRPWPWPERRRVSICGAARPLSLDLRPVLGVEAEWSRVAAGMPAGAPPLPLLPIGGRPRARVDAVLSPIFVAALSPTSGSALSPLRPRHRPSIASPRRLRRPPSSPRAVGMARERVGPPPHPRVQAERAAAGFDVAAAERNHCVRFTSPGAA